MAKKKLAILDTVKEGALATAGAYGGTKLSNAIETQLQKSNNANANKNAPYITSAIVLAGVLFAPAMLKPAFLGMTATAGAESLEKLEASAGAGATVPTVAPTTAPIEGQTRVTAFSSMNGQTRVNAFSSKMNGYRNY